MDESPNLENLINHLKSIDGQSREFIVPLFTGNIYPLDLFIGGILSRMLNLNTSFILLLENQHYLSAATLVRVQLDTLMRLLVPNSNWATLYGKKVRSLKNMLWILFESKRTCNLINGEKD